MSCTHAALCMQARMGVVTWMHHTFPSPVPCEQGCTLRLTMPSHALQLDPMHTKAAYSRGTCHNMKGDISAALGGAAWGAMRMGLPH